jgi:hypothetical protein
LALAAAGIAFYSKNSAASHLESQDALVGEPSGARILHSQWLAPTVAVGRVEMAGSTRGRALLHESG